MSGHLSRQSPKRALKMGSVVQLSMPGDEALACLHHIGPRITVDTVHCSTRFFLFPDALKHHLFLLAYPDSRAKSGKIKPAQCIALRDTVPTTAIVQPGNTKRFIWASTISWSDLFRIYKHTSACVNLVLLTYLLADAASRCGITTWSAASNTENLHSSYRFSVLPTS